MPRARRPEKLLQWVVYDHPADLPGYWVVRVWEIWPCAAVPRLRGCGFVELDKARAWVRQCNPNAALIQPPGVDAPPIYEVWM
jgi:hypothetical protein